MNCSETQKGMVAKGSSRMANSLSLLSPFSLNVKFLPGAHTSLETPREHRKGDVQYILTFSVRTALLSNITGNTYKPSLDKIVIAVIGF